ncbi:MAG: FG-GAP repeat domain-containing protein, partial [Rhizobiaceae bacterium]
GYAMPNGNWLVGDFNGDGKDDLVHAVKNRDYVHPWLSKGDGTFEVKSFKPWAGYKIPNGIWRVGDFNGDNRTDILHVVANTDYLHTWLSRGNGSFDVGTFRPWNGYAMPNGVWRVGDFDNDGKDDVLHAVRKTHYAHVWRSTTPHRFAVSTFSPWPRYAIPNGLWLSGDFDGDQKADIVHVVRATNYIHPWLSRMPGPGEVGVAGLELSQTVQDMAHSVDMIAGKTTAARAYLDLNDTSSRTVRGILRVRNLATGTTRTVSSLNSVTVNPAEFGNLRVKRENIAKSLNFRLPSSVLSAGHVEARLIAVRDASTGRTIRCADCSLDRRRVQLINSAVLRTRVVGLRYTQSGTVHAPRGIDFNLTRSWLRRVYPVPSISMSQLTVNANAAVPFGCSNANAQIAALRALEVSSNAVDARTHYYGLVFDGGFFMRGCTAGIPAGPSPQTVASGPTGPGNWGWDNDGSYGDWYTGHELGHTFGRSHIGSGCGDSASDPSYPYPDGQISSNDGRFVGLDTGDAALGIAMRALPGATWTDVMSYCRNQWMSDYTYEAIRQRINAENALPPRPVPTAGLAAASDEPFAAALATAPAVIEGDTAIPVPAGISVDFGAMTAPAYAAPGEPEPDQNEPELDVTAAYAGRPSVEPELSDATLMTVQSDGPPLPESMAPQSTQDSVVPDLPQPQKFSFVGGDLLNVVGTINLTRNSGSIDFVNPVKQGTRPEGQADDTIVLRILGTTGEELARHKAFVLLNSEREPGEDVKGIINELIPQVDGASSIEMLVNGDLADTFKAAPVSVLGARSSGAVDVQASLSDGAVLVKVENLGAAREGISYIVEFSADGGASWQIAALNVSDPNTTIDLTPLEGVANLDIRVSETTGFAIRTVGETNVKTE